MLGSRSLRLRLSQERRSRADGLIEDQSRRSRVWVDGCDLWPREAGRRGTHRSNKVVGSKKSRDGWEPWAKVRQGGSLVGDEAEPVLRGLPVKGVRVKACSRRGRAGSGSCRDRLSSSRVRRSSDCGCTQVVKPPDRGWQLSRLGDARGEGTEREGDRRYVAQGWQSDC